MPAVAMTLSPLQPMRLRRERNHVASPLIEYEPALAPDHPVPAVIIAPSSVSPARN
ncbi:MAG: hypothetical protein MZV63_70985 [Marinilabiliales bacterium]|nr:hypothetical protein [Marinilabiliales bacterium]